MARNLRLIESLWRYGIGGNLARFGCNLTRSVYLTLADMHPLHIAVSIACVVCGIGALLGYYGPIPGLLFPSVYFGWWSTMGAMLIGLVLAIVLTYRAFLKTAHPLVTRHWLGLL